MKIIHIARAPRTGVWALMRRLSEWQKDQGHDVHIGVLLPRDWPETHKADLAKMRERGIGVHVARCPKIFGTAAFMYHQVYNPVDKWLRIIDPDERGVVVHLHNAWLSGAFVPLRHRAARVVATFHGIAAERMLRRQPLRRYIHSNWAKRLVRSGAKLTSVDAKNPLVAAELFGVDAHHFSVIPNGSPSVPHCSLSTVRYPERRLTVGHVGVVDDGKGWRITAEAVKELAGEGLPVRMIIAGGGPDERRVRDWCANPDHSAEYVGYVSDPSAHVFPALDVLSLPSISEGLPMAIIEALSFGVPVIATRVGGIPEAIDDERNGFLIDRCRHALTRVLRDILANPQRLNSLSENSLAIHEERFSLHAVGQAYEAIYR